MVSSSDIITSTPSGLVSNAAHITVADLGFHEGGFVRSGALARLQNFLQTTPTSGLNHALYVLELYPGVELGVCLRFILAACSLEVVYTGKIAITVDTKK